MAAFDDAAEQGLENLTDTLAKSAEGWIRLFGWNKGPDGWTRDPQWSAQAQAERERRRKAAGNDRIQWVPKLSTPTTPMPTVQENLPKYAPPSEDMRVTSVGGDARGKFFIYEDDNKVMKVTERGETVWTRWKA